MSFVLSRMSPARIAMVIALLALAGCSDSSTGTVKGVAMLNGQPYSNAALILLHKQSGDGANVDLQADGTFQVATPLKTGEYTVYLAPKAASGDAPVAVAIDNSVPDAYWSEATSSLSVSVNPGANDVKLEIMK